MVCEKSVLLQCPCSGGKGNPLLLLAMVAGTWLLVNWARAVYRKEGVSKMNKVGKILIFVVLVVAVAVVIAVKQKGKEDTAAVASLSTAKAGSEAKASMSKQNEEAEKSNGLPRLVDLGAGKCIPCKMMAPILEELKEENAGRLKVEFIDVWENPEAGSEYGIKLIPTQIFYDASGKEPFRHEGFFSKEDILAKWKEFGVDLTGPSAKLPTFERLTPAKVDNRPKDSICYMCDGDINAKTLVTVQTDKGAGAAVQSPLLLYHVFMPDRR